MSFPGESPGRYVEDVVEPKTPPATNDQVDHWASEDIHDGNMYEAVDSLIERVRRDQAKLDARDWALGRVIGLLQDLGRPLERHEREIIRVAQSALQAMQTGVDPHDR